MLQVVEKADVVVIGGGVIGTSTAAQLARTGLKVKVLEKNTIGYGCSYGNAGWLTPCFAMPLPMPGLLLKSLTWMLDPEGPLYIKPSPNLHLVKWLLKFLSCMNEKQAARSIEVLVKLSQISLNEYKRLNDVYPGEFGFQQKGLLMLAETKSGVHAAIDELRRTEIYGVKGKILNNQDIHQIEPSLKGDFAGGVHFTDEAHAEPLAIVQTLKKDAEKNGCQFLENCEVLDFDFGDHGIKSVFTTKGRILADQFVLATGSWSKDFSSKLSLPIPILGGKGYSLIFPKLQRQPQYPIMILEKKIAVTPRADSIRVAGTLELVDQDFSVTSRRVKAIYKGAVRHLDLPDQARVVEVWRGLRPCTSDGVPMIGRHKTYSNLIFACGHQMLGLQTATGTAKIVEEIILNQAPSVNMHVLDPHRF